MEGDYSDDDEINPEDDDVIRELFEDIPEINDEEEGEDLYGSDFEKDYQFDPTEDFYDEKDIDPNAHLLPALAPNIKRLADSEIDKRHKKHQKQFLAKKLGGASRILAAFSSDEEDDDRMIIDTPRKKQKVEHDTEVDEDEGLWDASIHSEDESEESSDDEEFDVTKIRGPLREWVVLERPRRHIRRQFKSFLLTYEDEKKQLVYPSRIETMCSNNKESLEIDWRHLSTIYPHLAVWVADCPTEMLEIFDEICLEVVLAQFPYYRNVSKYINARISNLTIRESLRNIRQAHLNVLITVTGVVTRRTAVFPQQKWVKYNCARCQTLLGPFKQITNKEVKPKGACPQCQAKGPFLVNTEETIYRNYQRITLQESPGSVPPGRLPRTKDVILLGDLIDHVKPGDEVDVTGIYRHNYDVKLNRTQGFPVFATIIEANYLNKKENTLASFLLSEKDEKEIRKLARDATIGQKIVRSIAPSIFGHEDVKMAIAMSLFAGNPKELKSGSGSGSGGGKLTHRIRGDINVLLMGDPGTAKSQFLKYIEKTARRAVYTTGQGASAVGLTASVRKDPITKEWTLEGGALVLADNGVCLIDEFDKMNDKDRTSIHEAMEQQSISISKAGIVTTLQARCAIIAAANPVRGRYDSSLSFAQNVDLTEPILSRFDILCTVRDIVDPVQDEQLALFVVDSHIRSHPETKDLSSRPSFISDSDQNVLSQELLKKYITFAKLHCHPKLQNIDRDRVTKLYAQLRQASRKGGGMPMGVRHLESILRMSEAHAKMHLRSYVREDDVNVAIRVMLDSFIGSQKLTVAKQLRQTFRKFITNTKDNNELLLYLLENLMKEEIKYQQSKLGINAPDRVEVKYSDFETKAQELDITNLHPFFESKVFRENKFILDGLKKVIIKDYS